MQIKASLNYLHISPRKVRLVADSIRNVPVRRAERELSNLTKRSSLPLLKLLRSAVANAKHNFRLEGVDLYVKEIIVNPGSVSKRFRARAFGRAAPIRKRTSHVSLVLETLKDVYADTDRIQRNELTVRDAEFEDISDAGFKAKDDRKEAQSVKPSKTAEFVKRMFRRKAI